MEMKRGGEVGAWLSCSVNMLHKAYLVPPMISGGSGSLQCRLPTQLVAMHVGVSHTAAAGGHTRETLFAYANRRYPSPLKTNCVKPHDVIQK